jgi:hypothetical protein
MEGTSLSAPPPSSEADAGTKVTAGGQGRLDCYGQSAPEFKQMLKDKFVGGDDVTMEQLKFFLMFNDPALDATVDYNEHTQGWALEHFKARALALLDIEHLALLVISPRYWIEEVDNRADEGLLHLLKTAAALVQVHRFLRV